MPLFIKIHPLKPEISSILCQKTCEIDWILFYFFIQHHFHPISLVFWHKVKDISGLRGWILMNNGILEMLWVVLSIIKNLPQNFWNFIAKFGSKVEIRWKLGKSRWFFLNNSEVSSYLLGHILLFWNVTMQAIKWPPKI